MHATPRAHIALIAALGATALLTLAAVHRMEGAAEIVETEGERAINAVLSRLDVETAAAITATPPDPSQIHLPEGTRQRLSLAIARARRAHQPAPRQPGWLEPAIVLAGLLALAGSAALAIRGVVRPLEVAVENLHAATIKARTVRVVPPPRRVSLLHSHGEREG
jgi:hypothetical protein